MVRESAVKEKNQLIRSNVENRVELFPSESGRKRCALTLLKMVNRDELEHL